MSTQTDRPTWGEGVRALRGIYGFTVDQLAFLARTHAETIERVEAGGREVTVDVLARICDALHSDLAVLFPEEPAPERHLRLL